MCDIVTGTEYRWGCDTTVAWGAPCDCPDPDATPAPTAADTLRAWADAAADPDALRVPDAAILAFRAWSPL